MTTAPLPDPRPTASRNGAAPRATRRWKVVALGLVAFAALGLLAFMVVVELARGAIADKVRDLAGRYGLDVDIGAIDIPVVGGIGLRDVRVRAHAAAPGAAPIAVIDAIGTDVSLWSAALGKRRPSRVSLRGGSAVLRWQDGLVDLVRPPSKDEPETSGGSSEAVEIVVQGLTLTVVAEHTTALGKVRAEPFRVEGLDATLRREAPRAGDGAAGVTGLARSLAGISAEGRGSYATEHSRTPFTFSFSPRDGRLELAVEDPDQALRLGVETPKGPVWIAFSKAAASRDTPLALSGLLLASGRDQLGADAVTVGLRADAAPNPGLLPRLADVSGLRASGVSLRHGEDVATIGSAEIALSAPKDAGGVAAPTDSLTAWPMPRRVRLVDLEATARAPRRPTDAGNPSAKLSGKVAELEVGLGDLARLGGPESAGAGGPRSWLAAALADPTLALEVVTSLVLVRPEATLTLSRGQDPTPDPEARAPEAGAGQGRPVDTKPAEGPADPDDPPPFVGADDELPPAEKVVPVLAPGKDWLGALLGTSEDGGPGPLDAFVPAELRERLPALLARIAALGPKISEGRLTVDDLQGRVLLALEGAALAVKGMPSGNVAVDLRAAVLRDKREAGRADLHLEVTPNLDLDLVEGTVSGRSLAHQLARFVGGLSVQEDAEVDLQIRYQRPLSDTSPHHVAGKLRLASFSFEFWRIADREIRDLEATITFDASIDRKAHRLLLELPEIAVGDARFSASLDLRKKRRQLPSFIARLEMPRQDCGAAARSIPKGLIPNLPTLSLKGQIDFKASLNLDLNAPGDLTLEVTGKDQDCKVLSLAPNIDPALLRGPFVHHPREPKRGVLEHIAVGRGTPEWVPSERIPDIVKLAAWVTEDRAWLDHRGVRFELVARALKIDLQHGRFIYGGSTITQQLVKNLYLTRDKNLARKLEEAIIAWQMERVLTKDEILTTYINCIEYGPDIYGIKQAAKTYFGKRVDDLDALESAFIMGLKPYPKAGYNQFLKGELDVWWVRRVSHVTRLMAKFGPQTITPEEAEVFGQEPINWQPTFRRP